MIDEKDIAKIKNLQNFTGGFSDFVLYQLQCLILAKFSNAQRVNIQLAEDAITFYLVPYKGLKGWWKSWIQARNDKLDNETFIKYVNTWLPKTTQQRKIILKWQT